MKYNELNLKKVRDDNGLDFAHFTYCKNMCSCCYGPKDLPKRYWKDGIIKDDANYILFKNASNGSGEVKGTDEIKKIQYIEWRFPLEKMESVCRSLQEQVGNDYEVIPAENEYFCIKIRKKEETV